MRTLITGGVGSGTTFIALLFEQLGFDLGNDYRMDNQRNRDAEGDQIRGAEHGGLLNIVREWNWRLLDNIAPEEASAICRNPVFMLRLDDPEFAESQEEVVGTISANLPDVVKQPVMARYLGLWILAGGKIPEHVIVCMRDTYDLARSNVRDGFSTPNVFHTRQDQLMDYGMLWETLHRYSISHDVVQFPLSAQNFDYLDSAVDWHSLGVDSASLKAAWNKVANPGKIKTRDTEDARREALKDYPVRPSIDLYKVGAMFDVFVGPNQETGKPIGDFVVVKGA